MHCFVHLLAVFGALLITDVAYGKVEEALATDAPSTRIIINIPSRQLKLYHEDGLVFRFPVAVGQNQFKTPAGSRKLFQIVWNPWWMPPPSEWARDDKPTPPGPVNPLGPVKMVLGKTILMHGTTHEGSVGTAASHGCMRMYNQDAKTLAWWIQTRFSEKVDPTYYETYQAQSRTSFYVNLTQSIPVEITYEIFEIEDQMLKVYPDIYWRVANKKDLAIRFLETNGYDVSQLKETVLEDIIMAANKQSSGVMLKELIPGELKVSNAQPWEIAPKGKKHEYLVSKYGVSEM